MKPSPSLKVCRIQFDVMWGLIFLLLFGLLRGRMKIYRCREVSFLKNMCCGCPMIGISIIIIARDDGTGWNGLLTWMLLFCAVLAASVAQANGDACWRIEAALVGFNIYKLVDDNFASGQVQCRANAGSARFYSICHELHVAVAPRQIIWHKLRVAVALRQTMCNQVSLSFKLPALYAGHGWGPSS